MASSRYRNVPMSLADATLARLSEWHRDCLLFTLDAHFRICRRHGNMAIPAGELLAGGRAIVKPAQHPERHLEPFSGGT